MTDKIIKIKQGDKNKYGYQGVIYDSREEIYFLWWLQDANKERLLVFDYQPESIHLSDPVKAVWEEQKKTKVKERELHIFNSRSYTPDFSITWNEQITENSPKSNKLRAALGISLLVKSEGSNLTAIVPTNNGKAIKLKDLLFNALLTYDDSCKVTHESTIDVKGGFSTYNNHREFTLKQAWIYQTTGIVVDKIVPEKLFAKTFYPERYFLTDGATRKRKGMNERTKTLKSLLDSL